MRTIHKYQFSQPAGDTFNIPRSAKFLHAGLQHNTPCLWFEVDKDPDQTTDERSFVLVGTGHDVPEHAEHLGTVLVGAFVWHFYEVLV